MGLFLLCCVSILIYSSNLFSVSLVDVGTAAKAFLRINKQQYLAIHMTNRWILFIHF